MVKLSIIVPVYNVENYLRDCLDSILIQEFKNFELLLIDDGSSDTSGNICDEYAAKDNRVRVFHQPNLGVSSARNLGLKESNGEFITFIDSDDIVLPSFLSNFSYSSDIDFEIQGMVVNFINDNSKNRYIAPSSTNVSSLYDIYSESEYQKTSRGPCCKLLKNNIIKENNLEFPNGISFGEDAIFIKKYLVHCTGKARSIKACDYIYNQFESGSLTKRVHPAQAIYDAAYLDFQLYKQLEENLGKMPIELNNDYLKTRSLEFYLSIVLCMKESTRTHELRCKFLNEARNGLFKEIMNVKELPITYKAIRFCLKNFPIEVSTVILFMMFSLIQIIKP